MSLTRLFDRLLATLIAITAVGYLLAGVALTCPASLDTADRWLKTTYLVAPGQTYQQILDDYQSNGDAGIAVSRITELLNDLEPVQKVDQLADIKRAAYAEIVRLAIRQQDTELARFWTDQWLAFDDKDINAILQDAMLLMLNEATRSYGEQLLAQITGQFPHSLAVASGAARIYASIGEIGRAFLHLEPFLRADSHLLKPRIGEEYQRVSVTREQTPLRLRYHAGIPLHFSFTSSAPGLIVELAGIQQQGTVYKKSMNMVGQIHIASLEPGQQIDVISTVAAPVELATTLRPELRQLLVSQLRAMGAMDAMATLENHLEAN